MTGKPTKKKILDNDKKQIPLRLESKTYKALEELSSSEKRSVNGQIEFLLEMYLKEKGLLV